MAVKILVGPRQDDAILETGRGQGSRDVEVRVVLPGATADLDGHTALLSLLDERDRHLRALSAAHPMSDLRPPQPAPRTRPACMVCWVDTSLGNTARLPDGCRDCLKCHLNRPSSRQSALACGLRA